MFAIKSIALATFLFGLADAETCDPAYSSGTTYAAGAKVSNVGFNWQCVNNGYSSYCGNADYAPGDSGGGNTWWTVAWIKGAACTGVTSPTPPTPPTPTPPSPTASSGGCYAQWTATAYAQGALVSNNGVNYKCIQADFCSQAHNEPGGTGGGGTWWPTAWSSMGSCSGAAASPTAPSPTAAAPTPTVVTGTVCSPQWTAKSYTLGALVSNASVNYKCIQADFCSQAHNEPGGTGGGGTWWPQAWTAQGQCNPAASYSPTKKPTPFPTTSPTTPTPTKAPVTQAPTTSSPTKAPVTSSPTKPGDTNAPTKKPVPITATPTTRPPTNPPTPPPTLPPGSNYGPCPPTWTASTSLVKGSRVSLGSDVYECYSSVQGECYQSGKEPGNAFGVTTVWVKIGTCTGSAGGAASNPTPPSPTPASGGGSCPSTCPPAYQSGGAYVDGSMVYVDGCRVFKCKPYPYYLWCRSDSYKPLTLWGAAEIWKDAWTDMGSC